MQKPHAFTKPALQLSKNTRAKANIENAGIVALVKTLQAVDVNNPLAKLNASTISDNNGGRIEL